MTDQQSSSADGKRNNFDCARFLLAILVIYSHSYPLLRGSDETEPLSRITRGHLTLGHLAVGFFFAISGFLITQSWCVAPKAGRFFLKRTLRIYPAFVVATLVSVLIVAPLSSWQSLRVAPRDIVTSLIRLVSLGMPSVPGVFAHNPFPQVLNGSMWTIRYEFFCYVMTAVLGITGLFRVRWAVLTGAAALTSLHCAVELGLLDATPLATTRVFRNLVQFGGFYAVGTAAYLFRDRLRVSNAAAAVSLSILGVLTVWLAAAGEGSSSARAASAFYSPVLMLLGVYVLLWFAFTPLLRLQNFGRHGDFSYGVYLYAFPVQQMLALYLGPRLVPQPMFVLALPPTILLAIGSWRIIEAPCLKLKARAGVRTAASPAPLPF